MKLSTLPKVLNRPWLPVLSCIGHRICVEILRVLIQSLDPPEMLREMKRANLQYDGLQGLVSHCHRICNQHQFVKRESAEIIVSKSLSFSQGG